LENAKDMMRMFLHVGGSRCVFISLGAAAAAFLEHVIATLDPTILYFGCQHRAMLCLMY
jgi:hypothetical protein